MADGCLSSCLRGLFRPVFAQIINNNELDLPEEPPQDPAPVNAPPEQQNEEENLLVEVVNVLMRMLINFHGDEDEENVIEDEEEIVENGAEEAAEENLPILVNGVVDDDRLPDIEEEDERNGDALDEEFNDRQVEYTGRIRKSQSALKVSHLRPSKPLQEARSLSLLTMAENNGSQTSSKSTNGSSSLETETTLLEDSESITIFKKCSRYRYGALDSVEETSPLVEHIISPEGMVPLIEKSERRCSSLAQRMSSAVNSQENSPIRGKPTLKQRLLSGLCLRVDDIGERLYEWARAKYYDSVLVCYRVGEEYAMVSEGIRRMNRENR